MIDRKDELIEIVEGEFMVSVELNKEFFRKVYKNFLKDFLFNFIFIIGLFFVVFVDLFFLLVNVYRKICC